MTKKTCSESMKIEIKNQCTGSVMHTVEAESVIEAVVKLVEAKANLSGAYLTGAYLSGADLTGANLSGADIPHFQIVPEIGSFIGFKKLNNGTIATLLIPDGARRTSSLIGRKCRAERVRVLSGHGKSPTNSDKLEYRAGDMVEADSFDGDIRVECSHGIHFYMTRKEAEEHA